ncbi:MAG: XRE family transcriptional regulator [Candidatus Omnitrophota bacterium]|nr:XRE family transcriptional regulator [Candidatus Omnitrophota bacterium]
MYKQIWEKYRASLPGFPALRRPLVGSVIKEIRVDKGIAQKDFSRLVGIHESTLKSIENDHQQATTVDNLERCAKVLGLSADSLILAGQERDPANCFIQKKTAPSAITGIRKRKRAPEEWHQSLRLRFKDFDLTPISAPIASKKDFFLCRINLPPKRSIRNLRLPGHHAVIGFVSGGFNVKVTCGSKIAEVTSNQGFALDGFFPHDIRNDDEDQGAIIYLVTRFPNFSMIGQTTSSSEKRPGSIRISQGIEQLRRHRSDRPGRPISVQHLADLTDTLDHEQVAKMMRLKKGSSVVYWEKIEDLLGGVGVSLEKFLLWSQERSQKPFSVATATTRAMIDFSTYHGIKIYSAVPPGIEHRFFCGELFIAGKGTLIKRGWERKDPSMIGIYVEEGEMEVTVGKRRSALPILKGESIYFDGSLGYVLRNAANNQVKGFMAACPSIHF